jgi:hypothetical protein
MDLLEKYIHENSSPEDALLHELDRETHLRVINPRMISGHIHKAFLLTPNDERSTAPHSYPIIVGSELVSIPGKKEYVGTALIMSPAKTEVFFTDTKKTVRESFTITY